MNRFTKPYFNGIVPKHKRKVAMVKDKRQFLSEPLPEQFVKRNWITTDIDLNSIYVHPLQSIGRGWSRGKTIVFGSSTPSSGKSNIMGNWVNTYLYGSKSRKDHESPFKST